MIKILFIGVGSIAKRHIRNLSIVLSNRKSEYCIDIYRSGKGKDLETDVSSLIRYTFYDYSEIPNDYDIAFITNPTSMHYETIKRFVGKTHHMFIEKPIFDDTFYSLDDLGLSKDSVYYVAAPLRYTSVLSYIKTNVACDKAIAVRSISSSYLPEWRPGLDYRKSYSAHKDMGGGVSIDLIHEWDYMTWLFGMPNEVKSIIGKYSELEIDSDDSAIYIGRNEHTSFELHLDYYGRKSIRELMIFLPDDTIKCDLIESRVDFLEQKKTVDLRENRDDYQIRELIHFLDIIDGKVENDNSIHHAIDVLKLSRGKV